MKNRRAVLLAPSDRVVTRTFDLLEAAMDIKPARVGAVDIENTMERFINKTDVILGLSRYDGLDLPDEQCRVLILSDSPAAIDQLERHLSERWKMGPVLRKRERTRLIQGMGRCTRNATDFAVIVWMGQSLVNAATSSSMLKGFPPELAAEVTWGVQQSQLAAEDSDQLINMILGLIEDVEYRKAADAHIENIERQQPDPESRDYEQAGEEEVWYSRAMWEGDFVRALETAHRIADQLNSRELAGYRAWWWYLGSIAAALKGDKVAEQDALWRGSKCGVNSGWLNQLLGQRKAVVPKEKADVEPNAEALFDRLERWGWAGPSFEEIIAQMLEQLKDDQHIKYHEGLETLGKCFGATTFRPTDQGAPDVIWSFETEFYIAFEAKTEKKIDGTLSKKDLQEAKGHPDWVRANLCHDAALLDIAVIVVAPSRTLHRIAVPFAEGLLYVSPEKILSLAEHVADSVRQLRIKFSGQDFAEAALSFSSEMRVTGLTIESVRMSLASDPLK